MKIFAGCLSTVENSPTGKVKLVEQELTMLEFLPAEYAHEKRREPGMINEHRNTSEERLSTCSN
jgi:hypothetical protein